MSIVWQDRIEGTFPASFSVLSSLSSAFGFGFFLYSWSFCFNYPITKLLNLSRRAVDYQIPSVPLLPPFLCVEGFAFGFTIPNAFLRINSVSLWLRGDIWFFPLVEGGSQ
jgi:hypothetical protein